MRLLWYCLVVALDADPGFVRLLDLSEARFQA
jgi:hypothetical protein